MALRNLLLFSLILLLVPGVSAISADRYGCVACTPSPSGWCVQNLDTGLNVQVCAIGCVETQGSNAQCTFGQFSCRDYSGFGSFACQDTGTPRVQCSVAEEIDGPDSDCLIACAAECGRSTYLVTDCEKCGPDVCAKYSVNNPSAYQVCRQTCAGVCESNENLCSVIDLLRNISMFIAVVMLILHGFKWMLSDDVEGVNDAKRGVVMIFAALLLIVVAAALVEYMSFDALRC